MTDLKASESDMDLNDSFATSGKSNVTTDDELFDQLMKLPVETPSYLIPDKCCDETGAIEHMIQCFSRRYQNYPVLFVGTLVEALKDAFKAKRLEERAPLLIFVNHDKSVYSNLFFRQLMCQEKTTNYLEEHYLLWGWDVTFPSNCNKLNEIFKNSFPRSLNQIVFKTENPDLYPLLIGVYRDVKGEYVYERLHDGSLRQLNLDEFLTLLRQFKEKFVQNEQDLEKRRETLKNEMAARAASMQRHHFKRYHSIHPNWAGPQDYRAYLSMGHSNVVHNPDLRANMDEDLFDAEMHMDFAHPFKQIPQTPEDADDEEDEPAQTPTIDRPEPDFQRIKKA